jgi:aminoglycoside phosphotransferase (APT) family kinase protein
MDPVLWHQVSRDDRLSWRDWLVAGLLDNPTKQVHGWRSELAQEPALDRLFRAAEARLRALIADCPERRDLVHGDLLHKNVLVSDDASAIESVFSWKCSVRGDFLFDAAWCDFWSTWHPGIAAADPVANLLASPNIRADLEAIDGAPERLHCYELQIGATHLGWCIFIDDQKALREVAHRLSEVLERGAGGSIRAPERR